MLSAALLALCALPAHALSEAYGIETARPFDGAEAVPVNTMPVVQFLNIAVASEDAPTTGVELVLIDAETEAPVEARVQNIGSGLYQLVPEAPLEADTQYTVLTIPGIYGVEDFTFVSSFSTDSSTDLEGPDIPQPINIEQSSRTDEWGVWHLFTVAQRPAIDPCLLYTSPSPRD